MSDKPKYCDEEWLREQYVEKQRNTKDIAEECGCSGTTVSRWLDKNDIETRAPGQKPLDKRLADEEWLREQYIGQRKSTYEIAQECGCDDTTVGNWLGKHGIQTRTGSPRTHDRRLEDREWLAEQYVEKQNSTYDIAEECGCSDSVVLEWLRKYNIETRNRGYNPPDQRLTDAEWLRRKYIEEQQTTVDIAEECGCHHSTVATWLRKHNIEVRKGRPPSGADNHLWNGGYEPYGAGWNDTKKRIVRGRDGHTCQDPNCSVTQSDHVDQHGEKLHVHHLRKARDVDEPEERNAEENLITLCRDCHNRWEKIADAGLVPEVDGL